MPSLAKNGDETRGRVTIRGCWLQIDYATLYFRNARLCESVALQHRAAECNLQELLDGGAEGGTAAYHEADTAAEALLHAVEHQGIQPWRRLCINNKFIVFRHA